MTPLGGSCGAGRPLRRSARHRGVPDPDRVADADAATDEDAADRSCASTERRRRSGSDLLVEDPARRRDPNDLQLDIADHDAAAGGGRHIAARDRHVAPRAFGKHRGAQLGCRLGEPLVRLHAHVPVPRAVVAVADDPATGLDDHLVDLLHGQSPTRRATQRDDDRPARLIHGVHGAGPPFATHDHAPCGRLHVYALGARREKNLVDVPEGSEQVGHRTERIEYAYRETGEGALPLVMLMHFRGNLDNWDPALVDALAAARRVVTFDNAGVGGSSGTTPRTVGRTKSSRGPTQ